MAYTGYVPLGVVGANQGNGPMKFWDATASAHGQNGAMQAAGFNGPGAQHTRNSSSQFGFNTYGNNPVTPSNTQPGLANASVSALQNQIQNPGLNSRDIESIIGKGSDEINQGAADSQGHLNDSAAAMGISGGGLQAANRQMDTARQGQVNNLARDTRISQALNRNQQQLSAVNSANSYLNSNNSRIDDVNMFNNKQMVGRYGNGYSSGTAAAAGFFGNTAGAHAGGANASNIQKHDDKGNLLNAGQLGFRGPTTGFQQYAPQATGLPSGNMGGQDKRLSSYTNWGSGR